MAIQLPESFQPDTSLPVDPHSTALEPTAPTDIQSSENYVSNVQQQRSTFQIDNMASRPQQVEHEVIAVPQTARAPSPGFSSATRQVLPQYSTEITQHPQRLSHQLTQRQATLETMHHGHSLPVKYHSQRTGSDSLASQRSVEALTPPSHSSMSDLTLPYVRTITLTRPAPSDQQYEGAGDVQHSSLTYHHPSDMSIASDQLPSDRYGELEREMHRQSKFWATLRL